MLDIQTDQADGYTICRPVGELDAFTVSQFRQALAELAIEPRGCSSTCRACRSSTRPASARSSAASAAPASSGGDVAVACNRPTLTRLLRTTGFDRIVTVAETVEEAAAALGRPNPRLRPRPERRNEQL